MSELGDTINNFSTMLNNPALGGGSSVNFKDASELLSIFARIGDSDEDPASFVALIQSLADGGRKPTRAEWAALRGEAQVVEETPVEEEPPVAAQAEPEAEPVPAAGETSAAGVPESGSGDPATEPESNQAQQPE